MRIREQDVTVEHLRRSGPGGQHRNRRSTGVRVTHLPTGIVVMATERRSQSLNLAAALERLEAALAKRAARPKPRVKTKPTRSSRNTRIRSKKLHSQKKDSRKRAGFDD